MKRLLMLFSLLLVAALAQAQMYRWVDDEGNVQFSDTPPPEGTSAERMEVPKPSVVETYKPPKAAGDTGSQTEGDTQEASDKAPRYRLAITSPADDQAVRENAGNVTVTVDLKPALQTGHQLRLYLDGNRLDNGGTRTSVQLTNVPRGTHTLRAEVVDGSGKVLRRTTSTFHLLRAAVGQAPPYGGTPPGTPPSANYPPASPPSTYPPKPNFPKPPGQ